MRQFNLEAYLKNPNRKLVTRDGMPVRIICTDRKDGGGGDERTVIALVYDKETKIEYVATYSSDGKYLLGVAHGYDLYFAPTKREGWVNVYRGFAGDSYCGGKIHNTEQEAKDVIKDREYLTTAKIEWEE